VADCVFCKIVAGDIPNMTVYEDDQVLAFLDINPLVDGHTMVIPKAHGQYLEDLDDDTVAAVFRAVRAVSAAQRKGLGAHDTTIGINNGPSAGQVVPHAHVHIVPRRAGDGGGHLHSIVSGGKTMDLDEALAKLRGGF
jgi:histidine triad (HIT) family protein